MTTYTNTSKNASSFSKVNRAGFPWMYDQTFITYDGVNDPVTGYPVYYDSLSTAVVFTNAGKSTTVMTNLPKS